MQRKEEMEGVEGDQYDPNMWFVSMKLSKNNFKLYILEKEEEKLFFGV